MIQWPLNYKKIKVFSSSKKLVVWFFWSFYPHQQVNKVWNSFNQWGAADKMLWEQNKYSCYCSSFFTESWEAEMVDRKNAISWQSFNMYRAMDMTLGKKKDYHALILVGANYISWPLIGIFISILCKQTSILVSSAPTTILWSQNADVCEQSTYLCAQNYDSFCTKHYIVSTK